MGPLQPLFDGCPGKFPCIYFIPAFFFLVLAGFACRDLRRRLTYEWWTQYNVFIFLTFVFCLLRGLSILIWPAMKGAETDLAWIAVLDIPNLCYCLTYAFLLLIWAEYTWGVAPRRNIILKHCSPRLMFTLFCAVFFLGTPMLWVVSGHEGTKPLGKVVNMLVHTAMNALVAAGYILFGIPFRKKVMRLMDRHPVENEKYLKKKKRQMGWLIFVAFTSFVGNAGIQVVSRRAAKSLDWTENIILYLIVMIKELMVVATMQWMLDGVPPKAFKIIVPPPPPPKEEKKKQKILPDEAEEGKETEALNPKETSVTIEDDKPTFEASVQVDRDPKFPKEVQLMPIEN